MEVPQAKWWHVPDKDVEDLVAKLGGDDPFRATVVTAAARPPRPRVAHSPRPPVSSSPTPRVSSSPPPRATNSPRPQVLPGTPLMTFRSPAPRSRPVSARRNSAPQPNDGKLTVYVYNIHSSDKLVLRVHPDQQIGASSSARGGKCDDAADCDETSKQPSFKSEIARALGIDATQIRLTFHGSPLGDDEKTLKCYGILDGETVHLRIHRAGSAGRDEVILASAAKKYAVHAEREKDENLCLRPFGLQSPSSRSRLSQRCAQHGAALMPKWISQEHPKLFAPVGVGVDGHGGDTPYEDFCAKGIWTAPVDHPNQRGENQYGLQRVREGLHSIAARRGPVGGA